MSRKTLMVVLGFAGAIFGYLGQQFGLTVDLTSVFATLALALAYVFGEMKLDFGRVSSQLGKFKDPKFLIAFGAYILMQVNAYFNLNLPVEVIVGAVTVLLGLIFKIQINTATNSQ